jgi:hypothetical protein
MINYGILQSSVGHYESWGFQRIESPWTVTVPISDITKPKDLPKCFELNHNGKILVASGEQSFLYLYVKGFLPRGRFQTITPCFRYEQFDEYHTKYFIKNELIDTLNTNRDDWIKLVDVARRFFIQFLPEAEVAVTSTGEMSCDLTFRGMELGSYGIRECDFLRWVYGTGVAEPRLSAVMYKYGIPYEADTKGNVG